MKARIIGGITIAMVLFLPASALWGWSRHNLLTEIILEDPPGWVAEFKQMQVRNNTYSIYSLNDEYEIIYRCPDQDRFPFLPENFVSYSQNPERKYGFRGALPGSQVSAVQVLIEFSDEPDWGMDEDKESGTAVDFMGGSHGYRHMYYPAGTFHLPYPFIAQGEAPERAELFYEYAREAFAKDDYYWGFRFLARAVHYLMDLANPFHTIQVCPKYLVRDDPLEGTVQATKNFHFAYEDYVSYFLVQARRGKGAKDILDLLRGASPRQVINTRTAAKEMAAFSHRKGAELLDLCFSFFGEDFRSSQPHYLDSEMLEELKKNPVRREIEAITAEVLAEMSAVVRGVLELAGKDLISPQP